MFVDQLSVTTNESLFEVEAIKTCINFLWSYYFYRLLVFVFLPYCLFFVIFLVYATIIYDG
jgi:hypothetical protein